MTKRKPITAAMRDDVWMQRMWDDLGARLCCSICNQFMYPGQRIHMDHIHEVADDGPHSVENLCPIHYDPCHKKKTRVAAKQRAHIKRIAKGGRKRKGRKIQSRPMAGSRASGWKKPMHGRAVRR